MPGDVVVGLRDALIIGILIGFGTPGEREQRRDCFGLVSFFVARRHPARSRAWSEDVFECVSVDQVVVRRESKIGLIIRMMLMSPPLRFLSTPLLSPFLFLRRRMDRGGDAPDPYGLGSERCVQPSSGGYTCLC